MLKVEEKKLNLLNKLPSVDRFKGSYKKYIYVGITNDKSIKVVLIGFLILIFLKKRTNKVEIIAALAIVVIRIKNKIKIKNLFLGKLKYVDAMIKNPRSIPVTLLVEKKPTLLASGLHK